MNDVLHRSCPSCGKDNALVAPTAFGDASWPIKKCDACGFVYLEIAPVYERLVDEFAWEKSHLAESKRRVADEPIRQFISKHVKIVRRRWFKRDKLARLIRRFVAAGNVVDIGCAGGAALDKLDSKYVPHGIEISRALAQDAAERIAPRGGHVVHDSALGGLLQFRPDYFSGVLLSSFLEHEIEPRALLAEVRRTLRSGGRCIIKVPNYSSWNRGMRGRRWCGFRLPDHVNYFTPDSLVRMCREADLEVVSFSITDRFPTSDNMWVVVQRSIS